MIQPIKQINKKLIDKFDCGNDSLNIFFKHYALQNDRKNIGKTFAMIEENDIIGFYTLTNAQLDFKQINEKLKSGLPRYPIPAVKIARFAINFKYQGMNYGALLLKNALTRIVEISQMSGVHFIVVDAKKSSKRFYERFGFIKLDSNDLTYIMQISTVIKAMNK